MASPDGAEVARNGGGEVSWGKGREEVARVSIGGVNFNVALVLRFLRMRILRVEGVRTDVAWPLGAEANVWGRGGIRRFRPGSVDCAG
jgi:hypothetical protein